MTDKLGPAARIFLLSFVVLFAEVMAIRWLGIEMPLIRVFPNLVVMVALIASSAGLGIAAAQVPLEGEAGVIAERRAPFWTALAVPVLICLLSFAVPLGVPNLTMRIDAGAFTVAKSLAMLMVVLICLYIVFREIGCQLGAALEEMPALRAYSYNLLGSIAGVVAFGVISFLNLGPWAWIAICGVACMPLCRSLLVPVATLLLAALSYSSMHNSYFSAYSKLDVLPMPFAAQAVVGKDSYVLNSNNHYFHFAIKILDPKALADLAASPASEAKILKEYYRWLKIPIDYAPSHDRVLVLGAGSGNDVAFALNAGAKQVHAVEIDPIITSFGYNIHPNHPYRDGRAVIHNEDARTFLRYSPEKFDLIEFAYLDPGATIGSASFLRVDNYVYTAEAMKAALGHLTDRGVVSVTFASGPNSSITRRLYQAIADATGTPPIAYVDTEWDSVLLMFGPGAKEIRMPSELEGLRRFPRHGEMPPTKAATDNWPFLYLEFDSTAMFMYFGVLFIAVVLPTILIATTKGRTITGPQWGAMFFLGQGFMLIETKSITKLSLLFGATWIVSSIVILSILVLAYAATLVVSRVRELNLHFLFAALLVALAAEYCISIPADSALPPWAVSTFASLLATLPVFFGSIIFSTIFKKAKSPASFLSANLLGVGIGGLSENLALVTGIQNLSLVAMFIYFCAYACTFVMLRPPRG